MEKSALADISVKMKCITRNRYLTPQEAEKYRKIRRQIAEELPELIARHHDLVAAREDLQELLAQLKDAREARGLSLADVKKLSGIDRSILSQLETGQRPNPAVETLVRYADAVGKRVQITLADATEPVGIPRE